MLVKVTETENLVIQDAVIEDVEVLNAICDSWDDKALVEGDMFDRDYVEKCIVEGDLPPIPDASIENHRFKKIIRKDTDEVIGFYDSYYGYPSSDYIWTGMFLIDKKHRKNGYAQEVINFIAAEGKKAGYEKAGVGVHLKKWTGLRFWTKCGYDKILGIFGEKQFGEEAFSIVRLEKDL